MNTILENRIEGLIREKLCKKGQAYRKRRMQQVKNHPPTYQVAQSKCAKVQ